MPTYVFKCPKCNNELEIIMHASKYARPMCVIEGCDGVVEMEPQLQPSQFTLKGTGWTPNFSDGTARGPSTDLLMPKKFR